MRGRFLIRELDSQLSAGPRVYGDTAGVRPPARRLHARLLLGGERSVQEAAVHSSCPGYRLLRCLEALDDEQHPASQLYRRYRCVHFSKMRA